jgi:hypothetical protein
LSRQRTPRRRLATAGSDPLLLEASTRVPGRNGIWDVR